MIIYENKTIEIELDIQDKEETYIALYGDGYRLTPFGTQLVHNLFPLWEIIQCSYTSQWNRKIFIDLRKEVQI